MENWLRQKFTEFKGRHEGRSKIIILHMLWIIDVCTEGVTDFETKRKSTYGVRQALQLI